MHQFTLKILFDIIGIGSASGLLYRNNYIYLISDNSDYLYEFSTGTRKLDKIQLLQSDVLENIPKRIKPDFEAIAEYNGSVYIFGSGSTVNRNTMVTVDLTSKKATSITDLTNLYSQLQKISNIGSEDFNIEGAVFDGKYWIFFQRGNGGTGKNAVFKVRGQLDGEKFDIEFYDCQLPEIGGVEASFTDAVIVGDKIYILATAEDTKSTYDDGDVLGSLIGRLDLQTLQVEFTQIITDKLKLEGLTFYKKKNGVLSFLLCEDNDTDGLESDLFRLDLKL
ncbi:MAG TPA: hypothetical protein VF581_10835 [Flavobacterium sp.]|jgi:hypothetical protein